MGEQGDMFGGCCGDTSLAAAESVKGILPKLRKAVLECIRSSGQQGMTCDEVEEKLNMRHQTASARVHELMRDSVIVDSGLRRLTRSRRKATVWVVPEYA